MRAVNYGDHRLPERFWSKVIPEPNSGCWLWVAALRGKSSPYGSYRSEAYESSKPVLSHRYAYIKLIGPVDDSLVIDHKCRVKVCVNPYHLEPVPMIINTRRGLVGIRARSMTHCRAGHIYDADNTYWNKGYRNCKKCKNEAVRRYTARRRLPV